ncbi:hypothetical protein AC579_511 [Pseudocercospora musae]|uniref:Uncharacterized protein n=1 Tax=Pseudocercospora musae TaxID=113226 RepID=A0A139I690_9PEZI|nr:hypothetical protein AC579_511 [Pseudocercospora musae]
MLSTIRQSLHLSLPSSRKRHNQAYAAEASSDVCSTRTRTDLKRIASRWVDSKRASKYIESEPAKPCDKTSKLSRSPTVSYFKGRGEEQNQLPRISRSPEDLIASLDRSQSTSHGKPIERAQCQPALVIPSSSRRTASLSERSTTSGIKGKERALAHIAPSPTGSEASLRSLNKINVKEGFRDRQWEKARSVAPQSRDTSRTRSITPISELDHDHFTTQIRRKKKASDLRSVQPKRAASTSATSTRRKHYAFPALALLADDPESYKSWIEQQTKGKERVVHRSDAVSADYKVLTSPSSASWLRADSVSS